jgi:transcriptional regulator with XRE-family HTH domain
MGRPCAVLDFSGAKLRAARKQAGLSYEDLADLSCRSWQSIQAYELGAQRPSTQAVRALSRALGLQYVDLLSIEDVEPDAL